jgi:hypothetical protein
VRVFQIVAHTVRFSVALDFALGSLEFDGTVRFDSRVPGIDHWQSHVNGIWRQFKPVLFLFFFVFQKCCINLLFLFPPKQMECRNDVLFGQNAAGLDEGPAEMIDFNVAQFFALRLRTS